MDDSMKKGEMELHDIGQQMYKWAEDLFPIHRSLTGEGVRETLRYLKERMQGLNIHAVKSGTKAFDWTVPEEWNVKEAFIENEDGHRIVDIKDHNLHLVGYSTPIDEWLSREELDKHLNSLPHLPDAIPYITSYYKKKWGFCIEHSARTNLPDGRYHAVVKSELKKGVLNYADLVIPGESDKEIFFSTYICHPSMGNNELSGPVLATALAKYVETISSRKYTYRFAFLPETIGSIVYLSKHIEKLKENVVAGFMLTCVGDEKNWSFLPSRKGNTKADRVAKKVLQRNNIDYKEYSFLTRGSDERQYCAPGVDLPFVSVMRTKYEEYPEYHSSLDDLNFISPKGLQDSFDLYKKIIDHFETIKYPKITVLCEPQLGKRGLYPASNVQGISDHVRNMRNIIAYADGTLSLDELFEITNVPKKEGMEIVHKLSVKGLIEYD